MLAVSKTNGYALSNHNFNNVRVRSYDGVVVQSVAFLGFGACRNICTPRRPTYVCTAGVSGHGPYHGLCFRGLAIGKRDAGDPGSGCHAHCNVAIGKCRGIYLRGVHVSRIIIRPVSVASTGAICVSGVEFSRSIVRTRIIKRPSVVDLSTASICVVSYSVSNDRCGRMTVSMNGIGRLFLRHGRVCGAYKPIVKVDGRLNTSGVFVSNGCVRSGVRLPGCR